MRDTIFAKIRGLIFASSLFWFFFILHIIFASNGFLNLFRLVVICIFFLSHFHSLIALYLSKLDNNLSKTFLIKYSTIFSVIYSIGFWYAVNNMNFEIWIFSTGLAPLFLSWLIMRFMITDN